MLRFSFLWNRPSERDSDQKRKKEPRPDEPEHETPVELLGGNFGRFCPFQIVNGQRRNPGYCDIDDLVPVLRWNASLHPMR